MTKQGPPTRPSLWAEEAPPDASFRRARQAAAGAGPTLPGMPLDFGDPDEDDAVNRGQPRFRYDEPRGPWWRPASTAGRIFLTLCALVVLGGLTTAGLLLKSYLERDARFRITGTEDIQATGLIEVSRAELLPVFGEDIGRNIFFVPLGERRRQLEQIPWIERATVMRLLPDQIRVSIVERQPVAFTRQGNQIGLVDASGVLLAMSPAAMARHHYSFPVLTGIDPGDPAQARKTRMAVYLRLMAELDSAGQHYSEQISEIDLTDPEDARVMMPEQGTDILAHFGEDRFLERYRRYQEHIAEWRQQYPHLAAVDLRYDRQVVLEMASGTETSQGMADAKPQAGEPAAGAMPAEKNARSKSAARPSTGNSAAKKKKAAQEKKHAAARRTEFNSVRRRPGFGNRLTSPAMMRPAAMAQGG